MNYDILRQSMVLRASLVPYMYSQARLAYEEGLSLLRGMYYDFPEEDNAYIFNKQVSVVCVWFTMYSCSLYELYCYSSKFQII